MKAVSEGDTEVEAVYVASDCDVEGTYLMPTLASLQLLAKYASRQPEGVTGRAARLGAGGEDTALPYDFAVYLVRPDRTYLRSTILQLLDSALQRRRAQHPKPDATIASAQALADGSQANAYRPAGGREGRGGLRRWVDDGMVLHWGVDDVAAWLDLVVGLCQYQHAFRTAGVTGPVLVRLEEGDLHFSLGVTLDMHRRRY